LSSRLPGLQPFPGQRRLGAFLRIPDSSTLGCGLDRSRPDFYTGGRLYGSLYFYQPLQAISLRRKRVKTYIFKVVLEPDGEGWHVYSPALDKYGAATWGETKEKAVRHIQEVIEMIVEELLEEGTPIPEEPREAVTVSEEPVVTVTV